MTDGGRRVQLDFNPGNHSQANEVKKMTAHLIDYIQMFGKDDRLDELAMTAFEEGAMWAVKSMKADKD